MSHSAWGGEGAALNEPALFLQSDDATLPMRPPVKYAASLILLISVFALGVWYGSQTRRPSTGPGERKVLYWQDPMHPAYKSDKPGIAPDCGMQLEPVYAGEAVGKVGMEEADPRSPGAVRVSPERQQLIGVKTAAAETDSGPHSMRILGRVVPDETLIYRVNAATDGWVRKMFPVTTGALVREDDLLATFYAPEFSAAMKAYLFGLRSLDRFEASGKETKEQIDLSKANIDNYRSALRNLGMTDHQLDDIMRTRQPADTIEIRAPQDGFILFRNLFPGQRFERGTELYRLADLRRVWVLADIFENEGSYFRPGAPARITHVAQNKSFNARISNVLPQFDPATRTLKVRLEADNPGYALRPDMFVDVELSIHVPPTVAVPADAVVDTGLKKTVFVDRGDGYFEPREVETGLRMNNRVEITKGLKAGERIVVSGTFLVDSESRMRAAAAGMAGPASKDPVCGMAVDETRAAVAKRISKRGDSTYYFCSDLCKQAFDKDPQQYVKKPQPEM